MVQIRGAGTLEELKEKGIPVIDFSKEKDHVVEQVSQALNRFGFFAVIGLEEEIDLKLFKMAYGMLKVALNLPEDQFNKYVHPDEFYQRGLAPVGAETAVGQDKPDPKSYMQVFRKNNHFPEDEVPGITNVYTRLFQKCEELGVFFHRYFALALGLDEEHFDEMLEGGDTLIRAIRYHRDLVSPGDVISGEHTDVNGCTLLFTSRGQGLYIVDPVTKERIFANVPLGALIVNTGGQFGLVLGRNVGVHGVIQQPETEGQEPEDRYAIVAFLHYHRDVVLMTVADLLDYLHTAEILSFEKLTQLDLIELGEDRELVCVGSFFDTRIGRINSIQNDELFIDPNLKDYENPYTIQNLWDDLIALGAEESKLRDFFLFNCFGEVEWGYPLCERDWD